MRLDELTFSHCPTTCSVDIRIESIAAFLLVAIAVGIASAADPDDYDQWRIALGAGAAVDAELLTVKEGFEVDLLRSATAEEDSWISLEFDGKGRIIIGLEEQGILRITPPEEESGEPLVEKVNDTLLECRGLLWAYDSLYVNANNSKGFYRLRDTDLTDEIDQFDEVTLLKSTSGDVGHGRNDLALGPDGFIYLMHGNDVRLPFAFDASHSPLAHFGDDRLIPCSWDRLLFNAGIKPPGGHVIRTDKDGEKWETFAGGFRNQYGIAFNAHGEMFTFDADMEWDAGAPWYRPTRINHVISGGDYGWRQGTGKQPAWHPDSLPSTADLGIGSPTGVKFGTNSNFPGKYRRELFALDWAYGRIFAVHLTPDGASYRGESELFLKGRPLNVTDLDFGPDGAMYFVTGGRKTQSGLYRVRYVPEEPDAEPPVDSEKPADDAPDEEKADDAPAPIDNGFVEDAFAETQRAARKQLERYHGRVDDEAIDFAFEYLESADPWLRHAARVAVEHQPINKWRDRAFAAEEPTVAAAALLALARVAERRDQARLIHRLAELKIDSFNESQKIIALRAAQVACCRMGRPDEQPEKLLRETCEAIYPDESPRVNHLLCELLIYLQSPTVVSKSLALLESAETQQQRLHYLFTLRHDESTWTIQQRITYFQWLRRAEEFEGAQYMPRFLTYIRRDAVTRLTDDERTRLGDLIAESAADSADGPLVSADRPFVRKWSAEDLAAYIAEPPPEADPESPTEPRDIERGKNLYRIVACDRCHRAGDVGKPVGPDLSGVAGRFSRRDLLLSIIEPSKVIDEKHRLTTIVTSDGRVVVGRALGEEDGVLSLAVDAVDPDAIVSIKSSEIEQQKPSPISPMPAGLLDTLSKEEVLDLLAFLESTKAAQP